MPLSAGGVNAIGGGVSSLFGAKAQKLRAQGNYLEAANYGKAAEFADLNARFTETSTGIKLAQQQRQAFQGIGATEAGVAGAGFAQSGSALDLLREGTQQAALEHAVMQQQGLMAEAGYHEEARSYRSMQQASILAGRANDAAAHASTIGGIVQIGAGIGSLAAP